MLHFLRHKATKVGESPGTLTYVGETKTFTPSVRLVAYDAENLSEEYLEEGARLPALPKDKIVLVNVLGLHDPDLIRRLGEWCSMHSLVLEDILNTGHRPKVEGHGDGVFLVAKEIGFDRKAHAVTEEQVAVFWRDNVVMVFQENEEDVVSPILGRLQGNKGRIRKRGADYLMAALLDTLVDRYHLVLDAIREETEALELKVLERQSEEFLYKVYGLKREMLLLKSSLWPFRDILKQLLEEELVELEEEVWPYYRDVNDHVLSAMDAFTGLGGVLSELVELHVSLADMHMNRVMRFLTVIATIFIPLTFIAGVYGMNFKNMPELGWPWAYPVLWGIMIAVALVMVLYFKRKKWL